MARKTIKTPVAAAQFMEKFFADKIKPLAFHLGKEEFLAKHGAYCKEAETAIELMEKEPLSGEMKATLSKASGNLDRLSRFLYTKQRELEGPNAMRVQIHTAMTKKKWQNFFVELPAGWALSKVADDVSLVVLIRPFVLGYKGLKVKFSNLKVKFEIRGDGGLSCPAVSKVRGARCHLGEADRHHPHISGGSICFGEGCVAVGNTRDNWDLLSLYLLTMSTLHTYNPSGAYTSLMSFTDEIGLKCSGCEQWISKKNQDDRKVFVGCEKCGKLFCPACAKKILVKRRVGKSSCFICEEVMEKTEGKQQSLLLCANCRDPGRGRTRTCAKCGRHICIEHYAHCQYCGSPVCCECRKICPKCGSSSCPDHLTGNAELKEAGFCRHCGDRCPITSMSILKKKKEAEAEAKAKKENKI